MGYISHYDGCWCSDPTPARPKYIPRGFWARKTPLFQPKSLILKSNKMPLFKIKTRFYFHYIRWSSLFVKARLIVSNIFLHTFPLCLVWNEYLNNRPGSNVWKPGWKQADACKMFTLFQNFPNLCLKNHPFFLNPRIRAYLRKNTPLFAKVGTSVVYVLIGRKGGSLISCKGRLTGIMTLTMVV